MYIRVTRTVQDRGVLVRPQELDKQITDRAVDWYKSAFVFGEDAKEYWESNQDSIKGYTGDVHTDTLYWDLDCKTDFGKARQAAITLYKKLESLGLGKSIELYFSGNKGFHVMLATGQKFNNVETAAICYNIVKEAGIPQEVFDTTVYNITRIFRIPNTKHQESGLFKIPLTAEELEAMSAEEIRKLATNARFETFDTEPCDFSKLKDQFFKSAELAKSGTVVDFPKSVKVEGAAAPVDFSLCPPGYRKCVYALEQGYFGESERHAAIIRLAAYYKGQSYSRKHAGRQIFEALDLRSNHFAGLKPHDETECNRDIDEVYGKDWKGGIFTCKTDIFLQSKCDHGEGPCFDDARVRIRNVMAANQLFAKYVKYGEEALVAYPKFGLPWLDEKVRLRPNTFSMVAGANGSGKTSLVFELMKSLNEQKIFHAFFSLDMADSAVFEKLGAKFTRYTQREIEEAFNANTFNADVVSEVQKALQENLPYTLFDFTSASTLQYIEETVVGLKQVYPNLQVVIVDYAGKLVGEFDNQYANATANANKANDVVKRTHTHFMFLSQVSRENGDHTDPLRSSRVSKDSGAWEENATAVLTMWRPFGSGLDGGDEYVHIYIAKNRSGSLGENVFFWDGKTGSIREMETDREFEEYRVLCEQNKIDPPRFNPFIEQKDVNSGPKPKNDKFLAKKDSVIVQKKTPETSVVLQKNVTDEPKKVSNNSSDRFRRS